MAKMKKANSGLPYGPGYPKELYRNPFAGGEDFEVGDDNSKTVYSPSNTIDGPGVGLNKNYDKWWEGK